MKCASPYQTLNRMGRAVEYPCGRCLPCRANRAEEWATRIQLELEKKDLEGDFVTLTYDDKKTCPLLPLALTKRVIQLFFKRMRKSGLRLKYFACGEYGEKHRRAHYHAIILRTKGEQPNYEKHWPWGNVKVGTVTHASARYVTGYLTKSNTIPPGKNKWPPFQLQSQGMGANWAKENAYEIHKELSWIPRYLAEKARYKAPTTTKGRFFTPIATLKQRHLNERARINSTEK